MSFQAFSKFTSAVSLTGSTITQNASILASNIDSSSPILKTVVVPKVNEIEEEKMKSIIYTMDRYAKIVKTAILCFEMGFDWERKMAEGYIKLNSEFQHILLNNQKYEDSNLEKKENNKTIASLEFFLQATVDFQAKRVVEHQATTTFVQNQVLSGLRAIHLQIQQKMNELETEWNSILVKLEADQSKKQKLETQFSISLDYISKQKELASSINEVSTASTAISSAGKVFEIVAKDPWLISYQLGRHVQESQTRESQANMKLNTMIQQLAVFEKQSLQKCKDLIKSYYDWQEKSGVSYGSQVTSLKESIVSILEVSDLKKVEVNLLGSVSSFNIDALMIQPCLEKILEVKNSTTLDSGALDSVEKLTVGETVQDSAYEIEQHSRSTSETTLVNSLEKNLLQTRIGVAMKGSMQKVVTNLFKKDEYKAGIYILTKTGYLHAFDWTSDEMLFGEAKSSFYLPLCNVTEKDGHYLISERLRSAKVQPIDSHDEWKRVFSAYLN